MTNAGLVNLSSLPLQHLNLDAGLAHLKLECIVNSCMRMHAQVCVQVDEYNVLPPTSSLPCSCTRVHADACMRPPRRPSTISTAMATTLTSATRLLLRMQSAADPIP